MTQPQHIKESVVRSLFTVGCRGKRKTHLNPEALKVLTALTNLLAQEALRRSADACLAGEGSRTVVSSEDLQRVLAQLMLDFST